MEMYVKFLFSLTVGLAAMGFVLTTLMETILSDWDPVHDARRWWRLAYARQHMASVRAEDILIELEGRRRERSRMGALDRRREDLRAMREAEERLAAPSPVEAV